MLKCAIQQKTMCMRVHDFSFWPIRSGRFGLADAVWPFRSRHFCT